MKHKHTHHSSHSSHSSHHEYEHIPTVGNMAQRATEYSHLMGLESPRSSKPYYDGKGDMLAHGTHKFAKGGYAEGGHGTQRPSHGLNRGQTDMHMPHKMSDRNGVTAPHYATGGHHSERHDPLLAKAPSHKRGGHHHAHEHHEGHHVHHTRKVQKKGIGGSILGGLGTLAGGAWGGPGGGMIGGGIGTGLGNWAEDSLRKAFNFEKGGHVHKSHVTRSTLHKKELAALKAVKHGIKEEGHIHSGHPKKRAHGGEMPQQEMLNHSGREMARGGHHKHTHKRAGGAALLSATHVPMVGQEHEHPHGFRDADLPAGRKCMPRAMAKGGVGKLRHGQMTSTGRQIAPPAALGHRR